MKKSVALDRAPAIAPTTALSETFPAILRRAGSNACFAADEFFSAQVSNPHTRRAYARAVGRFLAWCDAQGIELSQVTPGLAGRFIEELTGAVQAKNQALAALRRFFDVLVTRHAVALNPFQSVRGRKHSVIDGQTPELTIQQARDLLASLDTSHVLGLRDRAVLGTLSYTGARVGAIAQLRLQDLRDQGEHRVLRFSEKGGKQREIPVRHDLDGWLRAYLDAAGIAGDPQGRAAVSRHMEKPAAAYRTTLHRSRHSAYAQAAAQQRRIARPHQPPFVSRHGGHRFAEPERADGRRAVSRRAHQPPYHPNLRPAQAAGDPQHRGAYLGLSEL